MAKLKDLIIAYQQQFNLMKPQEPDIRKYLRYYCTTASNVYGEFYWAMVDKPGHR